jgi:hypothetical protein
MVALEHGAPKPWTLSSARPLRLAFFEKRFDPFAKVGALADARIFPNGGFDLQIEFGTRVISQQALRIEDGQGTIFRQLCREFTGTVKQLFWQYDFIYQANFQRFLRIENPAREQQIASDFFSNLA